ncbi:MAG: penicillin-binding protein, partial [Actinobacteria bacterium]|nr:penicillin-binding protein [Actinomycetota bacterium]NIS34168.1 penicillin-binding protein [Actinomycetota bacterium]NIT97284.1 penicillin-binding protein [Actinomycetota bacterium]NIU20965.1 penicillin-binding protein [Actinomycetota bacterium]NIU68949.1 penicillin-binding protein [Actinomycetota bacterium]
IQAAAEFALRDVTQPAAIVVIEAATGQVRAVASRPVDGFDRAVLGTYPPGSTFKVVTATALLTGGLGPDSGVECP